jgi:tetratricopeptide (TPR) repeat protein
MAVEKSNSPQARQRDIRARVQGVVERFTQAEVARRTATSPANVHRYQREGRVPGEFLAALTEKLHINPGWLLAGEGSMLRTEISPAVAEVSGDLLEMIETMNAVARLPLAGVAAQPDRRQIHRLAESMESLERLRERLNRRTRPAIEAVLAEYAAANNAADWDRAAVARRTALALRRLTLDEEVIDRFEQQESSYLYGIGRVEDALEFDLRSFSRRLRGGPIRDEAGLTNALGLAIVLRELGRLREARRICEASLALARDGAESLETFSALRLFKAYIDLDLGEVSEAARAHMDAYPRITDRRPLANSLHVHLCLVTGVAGWEEALKIGIPTAGKCRELLRWAYLLEQPKFIERALRDLVGRAPDRVSPDEYDAGLAALILDLLSGRKRRVKDYERMLDERPPHIRSQHMRAVLCGLHRDGIARMCCDNAALVEGSLETEKAMAALPAELSLKPEFYAMHARNLRAIKRPSPEHARALARAEQRTAELVTAGMRLLSQLTG